MDNGREAGEQQHGLDQHGPDMAMALVRNVCRKYSSRKAEDLLEIEG